MDLKRFRTVTVAQFEPAPGKKIDGSVGEKFASEIAFRLQHDFGPLFREVRGVENPLGTEDELIVTGMIKSYHPGSRGVRATFGIVGGLAGASSFEAEVVLKDGKNNTVLLSAPIDKFWGWGGWPGGSYGVEEQLQASAAAVANTVARAKGWNP